MTDDPVEICQRLMGATIVGVEIDADDEVVKITLSNGFLEFEGDSLEMYVELTELDS
jgi:hypothetical protein